MWFRQVPGRPHEERPVRRSPVSIASLVVAVTLKPIEELPPGVHLDGVLDELGGVLATAAGDWYDKRGHEFCVAAPDVA